MNRSRCLSALRRSPWLALILVVAGGCTRRFFRERADRDVEGLLAEKSPDPRWALENWYVYPDGRARFADVDKPDHPRKPPDDPAAASLAPNPQPVRSHFKQGLDQEGNGYLGLLEQWDKQNRAVRAQKADDKPAAQLVDPTRPVGYGGVSSASSDSQKQIDKVLQTDEQSFLMTLDQALELSLFNSRDFQDRREDLYLTALPVTLQRFSFVTQLAAGASATRDFFGRDAVTGAKNTWGIGSNLTVSQLLPTGAALVSRLANQLVMDVGSGKGPVVSLSNLTLSVTQPLLQGGGWAVTLEPLTQSERNLVYGVRTYARFRKLFYVSIAGGSNTGGGIGFDTTGGGGNFVSGLGTVSTASRGYLPILLSAAQERNERENIRNLTGFLELFREYQGKGDFSELQVGQVEQQLLGGQSTLLQRRQDLANGLDRFKLQLGLPTRLPLELDDGPLQPITDTLTEYTRARDEFNALRTTAEQYRTGLRNPLQALAGSIVGPIALDVPLRKRLEELMFESAYTKRTVTFRQTIPGRWDRWKKLTPDQLKEELRKLADEYRELQVRQARLETLGEKLQSADADRLDNLPKDMALGQLEQALRTYETALIKKEASTRDAGVVYEEAVNNFVKVMSEARDERRDQIQDVWPKLPGATVNGVDLLTADLDRAQTVTAQQALANRLDLMNTRGQLNDAWRNIAVQANSLLGVLNVGYNYSTPSTPNANEPFALGGSRGRHQLVLTGELPLVRRAERNNYRTALINYQRARRNLQATEDSILNDVRTDLRNLRVLAENYRLQKRSVEVAYDQVENALDVLQAPPDPGAGGAAQPGRAASQGQQSAANAASLTQQLLNAQSSLIRAQNGLYSIWVNYLVARMTLYRDLERLPLDPRGVWIDEPSLSPTQPESAIPGPGDGGTPENPGFAELRGTR